MTLRSNGVVSQGTGVCAGNGGSNDIQVSPINFTKIDFFLSISVDQSAMYFRYGCAYTQR